MLTHNRLSIAELTRLVREIYTQEWTPSSEQQLARKIEEKGGVKFVEHNDAALSELSHLDDAPKSDQKVRSKLATMYAVLILFASQAQ